MPCEIYIQLYLLLQRLFGLKEVTGFQNQGLAVQKLISFAGIKVGDYRTWRIMETKKLNYQSLFIWMRC